MPLIVEPAIYSGMIYSEADMVAWRPFIDTDKWIDGQTDRQKDWQMDVDRRTNWKTSATKWLL